jgi:hypothetical protein
VVPTMRALADKLLFANGPWWRPSLVFCGVERMLGAASNFMPVPTNSSGHQYELPRWGSCWCALLLLVVAWQRGVERGDAKSAMLYRLLA